MLSHVPCVQEINLSFGEITEAAALVVAQAVRDKPDMEKVDLNGTNTDRQESHYNRAPTLPY